MKLSEFAEEFGLSRADVENWISRPEVVLRTHYADTIPGRARQFSWPNIVELALMSALVAGGCRPSRAAAYADSIRAGVFSDPSQGRWLLLPAGNFESSLTTDNITEDQLNAVASKSPSRTALVIDVGDIKRRAMRLYLASLPPDDEERLSFQLRSALSSTTTSSERGDR